MRLTEIQPKNGITIGGSQIGAIMGLDKYNTAYDVWCAMLGKSEKIDNKYMRRGKKLEGVVLEMFLEEYGNYSVDTTQYRIEIGASRGVIDAVLKNKEDGNIFLGEIKTSAGYVTAENITPSYILQLQWYLGLFDKQGRVAQGGIFIFFDSSLQIKKCDLEFDRELFNAMDEKLGEWYEKYIIGGLEPPKGVKQYSQLTQLVDEFVHDDTYAEILQQLDEIKEKMKKLQEKKEMLENNIKIAIGDRKGLLCGERKISWGIQQRIDIDREKLKDKYPEIYEEVKKISEYRVLRY